MDFAETFPDCPFWSRTVTEVSSNGLYRVDFTVHEPTRNRKAPLVDRHLTVFSLPPGLSDLDRQPQTMISSSLPPRRKARAFGLELGSPRRRSKPPGVYPGRSHDRHDHFWPVILAAIYTSWAAILRGSKVGLTAAAEAQRTRVAVRAVRLTPRRPHSYISRTCATTGLWPIPAGILPR